MDVSTQLSEDERQRGVAACSYTVVLARRRNESNVMSRGGRGTSHCRGRDGCGRALAVSAAKNAAAAVLSIFHCTLQGVPLSIAQRVRPRMQGVLKSKSPPLIFADAMIVVFLAFRQARFFQLLSRPGDIVHYHCGKKYYMQSVFFSAIITNYSYSRGRSTE